MEITEIDREVRRLKLALDALQGQMRTVQTYIRGKETPGSGISTWGTRPRIKDAGREGGGGGAPSRVVSVAADETYIHDEKTADQLAHELQHILTANLPAPTTGSDIVRSGTGHITVTSVEHQVDTAGHIHCDKTGAIASHGAPDQAASKTAAGTMDPTQTTAQPDTVTIDGNTGLAYNQISRVAFDPAESGGPNLYAFYRVKDDDQKGHAASLSAETRKEVYTPPWGSALNQMWLWGGSSTKYQTIAAPTASSQVLFYVGGSIGWVAASFASEVEGGAVPSAVIPDKNKGWIYKYARSSVVEIAHADPRNETVYKPPDSACYPFPACDARGHTIGWWYKTAPSTWAWNSPWGFGDPGMP